MSVREEMVNIHDLLDANGDPFSAEQAQSFTADRWPYAMKGCAEHIKQMVNEEKKFSDKELLTVLRPLNTHYRVRSILHALKRNCTVPAIGVRERDGKLYLKDGRHRCWAMLLFGEDTIMAEIATAK